MKARIAHSNHQKWKKEQVTTTLNARARRNLARKAKFVKKQTQQSDRYLKAPRGAPRNTPRRKIVLNDNDTNHLIPPYVPTRQKNTPRKFIHKWIPTGRFFSPEGSIVGMRA